MLSILYVDDEPSLLDIGKSFLEIGGQFKVDIINSAILALDLIKSNKYEAIVSDYQMPEMDGIQFLKCIRSTGNKIPFIIFTGRSREDVVIQALNEGADYYLQKGGNPKPQFTELAHKISQAVQQRIAEETIRDHQRLEADILNFIPDATCAIDTNGILIAWNRAMENLTGVDAEKILGKGNYEYALPFYHERRPVLMDLIFNTNEEIRSKYSSLTIEGEVITAETTIATPRGKKAILWAKATPLHDTHGKIIGAIETTRDITDLKKTVDALKESEERYRNVVEDQNEMICRFLPEGTHIFVNGAYCQYFGKKREEIIGKILIPDIPKDDIPLLRDHFASLTLENPSAIIIHRVIMPDGSIRCHRWSDRAIFNDQGKLIEYQSVGRDITDMKNIEISFLKTEEFYRMVFESTGTAMMILDDDMTILSMNREMERISGYSQTDIKLKTPGTIFVGPGDLERLTRHHKERRRGNPDIPSRYKFTLITRDHRKIDTLITVGMIPGTKQSVVSIIRDF